MRLISSLISTVFAESLLSLCRWILAGVVRIAEEFYLQYIWAVGTSALALTGSASSHTSASG
jgi:hypothetical protein